MINQQDIYTLLKTLDRCNEISKMMDDIIRITLVADIPAAGRTRILATHLQAFFDCKRKTQAIEDRLVLEFEHLEIEPILEQLST